MARELPHVFHIRLERPLIFLEIADSQPRKAADAHRHFFGEVALHSFLTFKQLRPLVAHGALQRETVHKPVVGFQTDVEAAPVGKGLNGHIAEQIVDKLFLNEWVKEFELKVYVGIDIFAGPLLHLHKRLVLVDAVSANNLTHSILHKHLVGCGHQVALEKCEVNHLLAVGRACEFGDFGLVVLDGGKASVRPNQCQNGVESAFSLHIRAEGHRGKRLVVEHCGVVERNHHRQAFEVLGKGGVGVQQRVERLHISRKLSPRAHFGHIGKHTVGFELFQHRPRVFHFDDSRRVDRHRVNGRHGGVLLLLEVEVRGRHCRHNHHYRNYE